MIFYNFLWYLYCNFVVINIKYKIIKTCKIIGLKFGPFEVLETVRHINPNGNAVTKYKCKCTKCGDIQIKQLHHLKGFKGDGCLKCTSKLTAQPRMSIHERNYVNYKQKINNQTNHEFNLTYEEFDSLVIQDCYYCGSKPIFPERFKNEFKNREIKNFNGIDRIDSNKGYILDNCVPCCSICNRMKSDMTQFEFLNHINKIYNFNQSSTTSAMHVLPSGEEMEGIQTDDAEDCDMV